MSNTVIELNFVYPAGVSKVIRLPSCLRPHTSLLHITGGNNLIVKDFSLLPSSLRTFRAKNVTFEPVPAAGTTGFDSSGNVLWSDVWALLPNLAHLNINSGNLGGSLPASLPNIFQQFEVDDNELSSSIPLSFLNEYASLPTALSIDLVISLKRNLISGSLPPSLFTPLHGHSMTGRTLMFSASGNTDLSGSIPDAFLTSLSSLNAQRFELNLDECGLNGSLPLDLFPAGLLRSNGILSVNLSHNQLVGPIPNAIFGHTPWTVKFDVSFNQLTEPLPESLYHAPRSIGAEFIFIARNNSISSTIPPTMMTAALPSEEGSSITASTLHIDLSRNLIYGSIPSSMFYRSSPLSIIRAST